MLVLENFEYINITEKTKTIHGYNTPQMNIFFSLFLCVCLQSSDHFPGA